MFATKYSPSTTSCGGCSSLAPKSPTLNQRGSKNEKAGRVPEAQSSIRMD